MPSNLLSDNGEITIVRNWFDSAPVTVYIGEKDAGFLSPYQRQKSFVVPVGTHTVRVRRLGKESNNVGLQVTAKHRLKMASRSKKRPLFTWSDFWDALYLLSGDGIFYRPWRKDDSWIELEIDE
jgi:hypothetical protein